MGIGAYGGVVIHAYAECWSYFLKRKYSEFFELQDGCKKMCRLNSVDVEYGLKDMYF